METKPLLLRSVFWYTFIGSVIIILLLYGLSIEKDRTELTKTRNNLAEKVLVLAFCEKENSIKSTTIEALKRSILNLENNINIKDGIISDQKIKIDELIENIDDLKRQPPKIITQYKDRVVYKDRDDLKHPYGKGYGKLTIYSACSKCTKIQVTVDNEFWGNILTFFSGPPTCAQVGTLSRNLVAGKHHIQGIDQDLGTWDYYTTVVEDKCNFWSFGFE